MHQQGRLMLRIERESSVVRVTAAVAGSNRKRKRAGMGSCISHLHLHLLHPNIFARTVYVHEFS